MIEWCVCFLDAVTVSIGWILRRKGGLDPMWWWCQRKRVRGRHHSVEENWEYHEAWAWGSRTADVSGIVSTCTSQQEVPVQIRYYGAICVLDFRKDLSRNTVNNKKWHVGGLMRNNQLTIRGESHIIERIWGTIVGRFGPGKVKWRTQVESEDAYITIVWVCSLQPCIDGKATDGYFWTSRVIVELPELCIADCTTYYLWEDGPCGTRCLVWDECL